LISLAFFIVAIYIIGSNKNVPSYKSKTAHFYARISSIT